MYKACLAALSAVVAVAFAAQSEKPTVEADESFPMIDTADLPKDYKDPHVFLAKRVYSSVPLESEIATSIADELDKICSDDSGPQRLKVVEQHFGMSGLKCGSWTYQIKSIEKKAGEESTEIHVDITPSLICGGRSMAILKGSIEECWIVDANGELACRTSEISASTAGYTLD